MKNITLIIGILLLTSCGVLKTKNSSKDKVAITHQATAEAVSSASASSFDTLAVLESEEESQTETIMFYSSGQPFVFDGTSFTGNLDSLIIHRTSKRKSNKEIQSSSTDTTAVYQSHTIDTSSIIKEVVKEKAEIIKRNPKSVGFVIFLISIPLILSAVLFILRKKFKFWL